MDVAVAGTVGCRYLVTVLLWQSLGIPHGAALVLAAAAWILWQARHCLTQVGRKSCVTISTIEPTISP